MKTLVCSMSTETSLYISKDPKAEKLQSNDQITLNYLKHKHTPHTAAIQFRTLQSIHGRDINAYHSCRMLLNYLFFISRRTRFDTRPQQIPQRKRQPMNKNITDIK